MDIYRRVNKINGFHAEHYLSSVEGLTGVVHISESEYKRIIMENSHSLTEIEHVFDNKCYTYTIHTTNKEPTQ